MGRLVPVLAAAALLALGAVAQARSVSPPGKVTRVKVIVYAPTVTVTAGPVPGTTTTADRAQVTKGQSVGIISTLSLPAAGTQAAQGVVWSYSLQAGFSLVAATGPRPITSTATVEWPNPDGTSRTASASTTIVVLGAALSVVPDAARGVSVPCGDVPPGESRAIVLALRCDG